jgi:hypothetical protein
MDSPATHTKAPSPRARLFVAIGVALISALIARIKFDQAGGLPFDFTHWWVAARVLLAGNDPYEVIKPGVPYPWFDSHFMYPLPAAVITVPIAWLSGATAGILFDAIGMGLLAFALTRDGWQRWPILMSFPALWCVSSGQWSTYVTAAALIPALGWVAACKPTLGFAAFLYRPRWSYIVSALILVAAAIAIMPSWPWRWLDIIQRRTTSSYHTPLLAPGGVLLVLAALRWRRPDARLLLGMACVPQSMFAYDQLPLGLIAETRKQALIFSLWSYLGIWGSRFVSAGPIADTKADTLRYLAVVITWTYYLPLLVVVLRRPNVGATQPWLERATAGWPAWLRGERA